MNYLLSKRKRIYKTKLRKNFVTFAEPCIVICACNYSQWDAQFLSCANTELYILTTLPDSQHNQYDKYLLL